MSLLYWFFLIHTGLCLVKLVVWFDCVPFWLACSFMENCFPWMCMLAFHSTLVEICHGFKLGFCPTYPFKPAKMVGWSACIGCRWVPGHWGVTGEGGRPVRLPLLTQPLGEQLLRYLTMGVSGKVASHCGPFVSWGVWCHWRDQPRWIYPPLHYGGSGDWPSFPVQHLAPADGSLWQTSSLCSEHHEDMPCLKGVT